MERRAVMDKIVLTVFILVLPLQGPAQPLQLNNHHASALFINPAFAGVSPRFSRYGLDASALTLFYKTADIKAGPALSGGFSFSRYIRSLNSGTGMTASGFNSGEGSPKSYSLLYAYHTVLGNEHPLSMAISAGVRDWGEKQTADLGWGVLYYGRNYFISLSAFHINRPVINDTVSLRAPVVCALFVKKNFTMTRNAVLSATFLYDTGKEADVFSDNREWIRRHHLHLNVNRFSRRAWYQGSGLRYIPGERYAFLLKTGFRFGTHWLLGYGYEVSRSATDRKITGMHELALKISFNVKQ